MKKREIQDLKTKTVDELKAILVIFEEEIGNLKIDKARKKLKNTNAIKIKKKELARVLTFLTLKEYASGEAVKEEK